MKITIQEKVDDDWTECSIIGAVRFMVKPLYEIFKKKKFFLIFFLLSIILIEISYESFFASSFL